MFRANESAFVETKRKLVDECSLWCIISLPGGVFSTAGAGVKTNLLFFTKGKKTEKIWYYDLSLIKVGKKTPMTLDLFGFGKNGEVLDDNLLPATLTADWLEDEANQGKLFPSYARLLASRGTPAGESRYSWTIDFADRRKVAREEMQPYLEEAAKLKADVVSFKEKLKILKKNDATKEEIEALELNIKEMEKSARDAQAKADELDAAVFDLKAVNPNVVTKLDLRTTDEIIGNIEEQGRIVSDALVKLKTLLQGAF